MAYNKTKSSPAKRRRNHQLSTRSWKGSASDKRYISLGSKSPFVLSFYTGKNSPLDPNDGTETVDNYCVRSSRDSYPSSLPPQNIHALSGKREKDTYIPANWYDCPTRIPKPPSTPPSGITYEKRPHSPYAGCRSETGNDAPYSRNHPETTDPTKRAYTRSIRLSSHLSFAP